MSRSTSASRIGSLSREVLVERGHRDVRRGRDGPGGDRPPRRRSTTSSPATSRMRSHPAAAAHLLRHPSPQRAVARCHSHQHVVTTPSRASRVTRSPDGAEPQERPGWADGRRRRGRGVRGGARRQRRRPRARCPRASTSSSSVAASPASSPRAPSGGPGTRCWSLEARDRVGGRVLNHRLSGGSVIESGGAFVGPTQDRILALARELDVPTFKEYAAGNNVYVSSKTGTHGVHRHDPAGPADPARRRVLQTRIDEMSTQVPGRRAVDRREGARVGHLSVDQWLRENTREPRRAQPAAVLPAAAFGSDGLDMSLLFFLWYIATAGQRVEPRHLRALLRHGRRRAGLPLRRRLAAGPAAARGPARLPGRAVRPGAHRRQYSDHVVVLSDRGSVRAKRRRRRGPAVDGARHRLVAVMPPRREQLMQRMPMGALMKCDAVYVTPFWRAKGLSGMGLNDQGAVRVCFDNSPSRRLGRGAARVRRRHPPGRRTARCRAAARRRGRARGLRGDRRRRGAAPGRVRRARLDPRALDPGLAGRAAGARRDHGVRLDDPHAVPPRALGRHRDRDLLGRLHGRRRPRRRAGRPRGGRAL